MGGIDSWAMGKPLPGTTQGSSHKMAKPSAEAPPGVKTKKVAREAKPDDGKSSWPSRGECLGWGVTAFGLLGAAVLGGSRSPMVKRFVSEKLALPKKIDPSEISAKPVSVKASEGNGVAPKLMTKEEWLAKPPVNELTVNTYEPIIVDGKEIGLVMSKPLIPEGATPETYTISSILDNFLERDMPVRPEDIRSHGEVVQEFAMMGQVKDRVGVYAIHIHDFDNDPELLEHLFTTVLSNKEHPYKPYLSHMNFSYGSPYLKGFYFETDLDPLIELEQFNKIEIKSKAIREKILESNSIKIFEAAGNDGTTAFGSNHAIQLPTFNPVGATTLSDEAIASFSSQTSRVGLNARGIFPFTVTPHKYASPYREGIVTDNLMSYVPDHLKPLQGKMFKELDPNDFFEQDGILFKKYEHLNHLKKEQIEQLDLRLDLKQRHYYHQKTQYGKTLKTMTLQEKRTFWTDFLNTYPSGSSHRGWGFLLNEDGTLNYVIPEFSFTGTSFSSPIAMNDSLAKHLNVKLGPYPVMSDSKQNRALYEAWRKANIPEELWLPLSNEV